MFEQRELNFNTTQIGTKKYLELRLNEEFEIKEFEVNMLSNNPNLPFIKVETRQINNEKKLIFDIDNKTSLREYIKVNKLAQRDFIDMVASILNTLNTAKDYMLNGNKIVLNSDKVFIEEYSRVPYLMFIPIDKPVTADVEADFLKMCKGIIGKLKKESGIKVSEKQIINELLKAQNLVTLKELLNNYTNDSIEDEKSSNRDIEEKKEVELTPKRIRNSENEKQLKKKQKAEEYTVIEEDHDLYSDYEEEDEEDEDDDLEYQDYLHEKKYYGKEPRDNTNRLLIVQLIVVIFIGSLVLLLSIEDKQFFTMMIIIIALDVLLCIVVFFMNIKKKRKGKEIK